MKLNRERERYFEIREGIIINKKIGFNKNNFEVQKYA
jgi:hypothetical protein